MRFTLDPHARSPLFRQIEDQVRYAITVGTLTPGEALPSIREVEATLDVNRNTVRRAYLQIESEGLIVLRQGREARVADRKPPRAAARVPTGAAGGVGVGASTRGHARLANQLATTLLQRSESEGLDALQAAEHFARLARAHDAAHPKLACVECDPRQARAFARHASRLLGRTAVGVDLHDLHDDPRRLPGSVRFVLAPHWHLAEARSLLRGRNATVFAVGMRLSAACVGRLRALAGRPVGVVVRDAESAPGFAEIVREHVGTSPVSVASLMDPAGLAALVPHVGGLVFTTPCGDAVRAARTRARAGDLAIVELVFEPLPQDVLAVQAAAFPPLTPNAGKRIARIRTSGGSRSAVGSRNPRE